MDETDLKAAERLRSAREKAGHKSAAAAAREHGWGEAAYRHHENGTRAFGFDQAVKYANAFKVSASWLIFGPSKSGGGARVPMAAFYIKVFADNLGEDDDLRRLIDDMHIKLGLSMFPELSIGENHIEWLMGPDGIPPMHFVNPSEIDVDPKLVSEGFVFAYRVRRRAPSRRFSAGDLLLIDSSVESTSVDPAYYLFRDEDGPVIYMALHSEQGDIVLMTTDKGEAALNLSTLEPIALLGRVVWIGQRL